MVSLPLSSATATHEQRVSLQKDVPATASGFHDCVFLPQVLRPLLTAVEKAPLSAFHVACESWISGSHGCRISQELGENTSNMEIKGWQP